MAQCTATKGQRVVRANLAHLGKITIGLGVPPENGKHRRAGDLVPAKSQQRVLFLQRQLIEHRCQLSNQFVRCLLGQGSQVPSLGQGRGEADRQGVASFDGQSCDQPFDRTLIVFAPIRITDSRVGV